MGYYDIHDWDIEGWPGEYVYGEDMYIPDDYMGERWKPIRGFEHEYWVSNMARVWSIKRQKFLKLKPMDDHGHLGVCLTSNGERYYEYIHQLVAEAFIPNPRGYKIVRHLYDNPECNEVEDLAWGTQRDNWFDCVRNGRAYFLTDADREKGHEKVRTPIRATNLITGESYDFRGQGEAARALGIPQANIWKVLNKQRPHAHNFTFDYIERGVCDGYY